MNRSPVRRMLAELRSLLEAGTPSKWDVTVHLYLAHWGTGSRSEVSADIRRKLDYMGVKGSIGLTKAGDEWTVEVHAAIKDQVDAENADDAREAGIEIGKEALSNWEGDEGKILGIDVTEAGGKAEEPKVTIDLVKAVMELERIRSRGLYNMLDLDRILAFAERARMTELPKLSDLSRDERTKTYSDLLQKLGQARGSLK